MRIKLLLLVSLIIPCSAFADSYVVTHGTSGGGDQGKMYISNDQSLKSTVIDVLAMQGTSNTWDALDSGNITYSGYSTNGNAVTSTDLLKVTDIVDTSVYFSRPDAAVTTTQINGTTYKYGRQMVYDLTTSKVTKDTLIAYSQVDYDYAISKGVSADDIVLAEGSVTPSAGGTSYRFTSYSINALSSGALTSKGGLFAEQIMDKEGNSIVRKESDGTTHIGKNSIVFSDSTITTHGNDQIHSSVGKLQLGNSASHRTIIQGTLEIAEPTASNHATTKSYVDGKVGDLEDFHHQGMSMQAATSSIVYGPKGFGVGIGGNIHNKYAIAAGYVNRELNLGVNVSSDMQDQIQFGAGWGW